MGTSVAIKKYTWQACYINVFSGISFGPIGILGIFLKEKKIVKRWYFPCQIF